MTERRIASIHFPHLAMQRWRKANAAQAEPRPIALVSEGAHGILLDAVNRTALDAGMRPGMRLTDARAACPTLAVAPSDPQGDAQTLQRLCGWSERWCPWSAVGGLDALLLDVTGSAHLLGGEQALIADMRHRFRAMGLSARIAIAPTIGAAWALARHAGRPAICTPDALMGMLRHLPVALLRLDSDTVLLLERLGLKTIGALADIPTLGLARRFGRADSPWVNPPLRLGQALGRISEPVCPTIRNPVPRATQKVAEPVLHVSVLEPIVAGLAEILCTTLEARHAGARHLLFQAFRVDGDVQWLEARTARALREPAHMLKLFAERFETLDAGFGFDAFALTAAWHEPLDAAQAALIGEVEDETSLPRLIDRLSVRLGADNVRRLGFAESHVPERGLVWREALADALPPIANAPLTPERPIRLFDRPEPIAVIYATPEGEPRQFQWRRKTHRVVRMEGPERIAPEWWRERSTVRLRDYYRVEDAEGRRYWIFRNGVIGDGRGGMPDWFLHGMFA